MHSSLPPAAPQSKDHPEANALAVVVRSSDFIAHDFTQVGALSTSRFFTGSPLISWMLHFST